MRVQLYLRPYCQISIGLYFYLRPLPKKLLNFFMSFNPNIAPSKTAIPVLNALIIALALLVAGATGANISLVMSVIISFCIRICRNMVFFAVRCSPK